MYTLKADIDTREEAEAKYVEFYRGYTLNELDQIIDLYEKMFISGARRHGFSNP